MSVLGKIEFNNNHGITSVFQASVVSINGLIADENELSSCKLGYNAKVYCNDLIVGKLLNKNYRIYSSKLLELFFTINDSELADYIYENPDYFIATAIVKCNGVTCPVCNNLYKMGQNACECIYLGPLLIINSFDIIGLKLFDTSKSTFSSNDKEDILRDFFGGAVGNIVFTEEI